MLRNPTLSPAASPSPWLFTRFDIRLIFLLKVRLTIYDLAFFYYLTGFQYIVQHVGRGPVSVHVINRDTRPSATCLGPERACRPLRPEAAPPVALNNPRPDGTNVVRQESPARRVPHSLCIIARQAAPDPGPRRVSLRHCP